MFKVLQGVLSVTRKEIGSGPLDLMIVYCMESFRLENKKDLNPIFFVANFTIKHQMKKSLKHTGPMKYMKAIFGLFLALLVSKYTFFRVSRVMYSP